MKIGRAVVLLVTLGLSMVRPLAADDGPPVVFAKEFSADQVITSADGSVVTNHLFTDSGKVRTEMKTHGQDVVAIILPDEQKIYSILEAQKMVMEMPYSPDQYASQMQMATGVGGKFDLVGPDTIDGVACTKYKETAPEGKTYFLWADANKMPVKMAATDGSFSMLWKNYKPGPQPAALFVVPTGYQVMKMPSLEDMSKQYANPSGSPATTTSPETTPATP